jgi:hypothetical protein
MRIKFLKNCKEYKKDQVVDVTRNIAHSFIDNKSAVIFVEKRVVEYKDTMLRSYKQKNVSKSRKY